MTILTDGSTIRTHYSDLVVTRTIDSKICKICMDKKLPKAYALEVLTLLTQLSELGNEDFKALTAFQLMVETNRKKREALAEGA